MRIWSPCSPLVCIFIFKYSTCATAGSHVCACVALTLYISTTCTSHFKRSQISYAKFSIIIRWDAILCAMVSFSFFGEFSPDARLALAIPTTCCVMISSPSRMKYSLKSKHPMIYDGLLQIWQSTVSVACVERWCVRCVCVSNEIEWLFQFKRNHLLLKSIFHSAIYNLLRCVCVAIDDVKIRFPSNSHVLFVYQYVMI